jgi:glycosyltransferase involved in cell wall biosynthesis
MKRQHLILEALALADHKTRIIIAGPADTDEDADQLKAIISEYNLQGQVTLDIGFHSREKIATYVNRCAASIYIPLQEDSYGYVAGEAAISGKPVITCNDSGGILEIIKNGESGWVTKPTPTSLSQVFDTVTAKPDIAAKLGRANKQNFESLGINWNNIVEKLLA